MLRIQALFESTPMAASSRGQTASSIIKLKTVNYNNIVNHSSDLKNYSRYIANDLGLELWFIRF